MFQAVSACNYGGFMYRMHSDLARAGIEMGHNLHIEMNGVLNGEYDLKSHSNVLPVQGGYLRRIHGRTQG